MSLDHMTRALQDYLRAEQYLSIEKSQIDSAAQWREAAKRELEGALHSPLAGADHPLAGTIRGVLAGDLDQNQAREKLRQFIGQTPGGEPSKPLILIAVDNSDPARWAVAAGAKLAHRLGARVLLMNVINPVESFAPEIYVPPSYYKMLRQAAESILKASRELLPRDLEYTTLLEEGDPAMKIALIARERGVDYIFIGTHGRGRIGHLLLGSTATGVARLASCPVVVVSHDQADAAPPTPKTSRFTDKLLEMLNPEEVAVD